MMSIWLSFSDAQAGSQKWKFIGTANYSKVESYELLANDFVLGTFPDEASAKAFLAAKPQAKLETTKTATGATGALVADGKSVPLLAMASEDDLTFVASTIVSDMDWRIEKSGGKWKVLARSASSPLSLGTFKDGKEAEKAKKDWVLVPANVTVKTNGTGVVQDPNFRLALKNTFKYTFGTEAIKLCLGIPCALILNRRFYGRRLLRGLLVIPWVIPIAISAQAWLWILDSSFSVINWCLVHWHLISPAHVINFRGDKDWAMLSVIAVNVWRGFPFTTIVILAGLTAIPDEILERARLEGANAFQRFLYIISPMVRPILLVSLLFSIIFSFTDFNTIWIITKGGPYDQTQVLATYAYQLGVNAGYLGKGAAVSLFMFPIMAVMVGLMLRFLRRET
jgi:multiple sugar transport system permease protein